MSELKTILKWGLIAGAIYGAYKLGQMSNESEKEMDNSPELDEVERAISEYESKPNKTVKDRNTLDLLKLKLKQLKSW